MSKLQIKMTKNTIWVMHIETVSKRIGNFLVIWYNIFIAKNRQFLSATKCNMSKPINRIDNNSN